MTVIFKCFSCEANAIKVLTELLQSNIKTACFKINRKGIHLRMMNQRQPSTILIDLSLEANSFNKFSFKSKEKNMYIGINLAHMGRVLKCVKKKDSIRFSIDDDNPTELEIQIVPKENTRVTTSSIKIQNIQSIEIDLPEGYEKPVIVPAGDLHKTLKSLSHISNQTKIVAKGSILKFVSDAGDVMKRVTEFGDPDEDEEEDQEEFDQMFESEQLSRLGKISGLCPNLQIYAVPEAPLLFRANVGALGKISLYLKSIEQRDKEAKEQVTE